MIADSVPKIMLGVWKTVQRDKTASAPIKRNVLNFMLNSLSALLIIQHITIFTDFDKDE